MAGITRMMRVSLIFPDPNSDVWVLIRPARMGTTAENHSAQADINNTKRKGGGALTVSSLILAQYQCITVRLLAQASLYEQL